MRRPTRVTEAEIGRAIRAAKKANVAMAVEIAPDGTIRLLPVQPETAPKVKTPLASAIDWRL